MRKQNTKKLVTLAMLSAIAFLMVFIFRIPIFPSADFLKYEPKDVIITFGGFLYGPLAALFISLAVSLIEMVTISSTGIIGFAMNVLSTCAFSCTAALIYKKKHTLSGAVIGLSAGTALMTLIMILWNYLLTPLYMKVDRAVVAGMLVPVILPFNLLKGGINASLASLLYRPLIQSLRSAKLFPESTSHEKPGLKSMAFFYAAAAAVLCAGIFIIIWLNV